MARGFITSVFLYFMSITMVYATGVVCSAHNDSRSDCNNEPGCHVIEAQNANNNFFCDNNCSELTTNTCENYAGCKLGLMGACIQNPLENRYPTWETDHFEYHDCPPDHPKSQVGNDSIDFCYNPCADGSDDGTNECGVYRAEEWNNIVSCLVTNTDNLMPSDDFHIEDIEGDKCFLNTRPCNLFPLSVQGITSPNPGNVSGNAIWSSDEERYTTSGCTYEDTTVLNDTLHCKQAVSYHGGQTAINANATISYASGSGSSYYCQSCENKEYYPTTNKPNEYHSCGNNPSGTTKACSCIKIEVGYYNSCSNGWNNNMTLNQCHSRCPIGQTTSGEGSTDISACQYKDDTQICDGDGTHCVTLNSVISGAAANTWTSMLP